MTPHQAVEEMMKLSEEQSRLSERFTVLEVEEIKHFNEFRSEFGSDKQASMAFKRSPLGIEHLQTKARLKIIGKELSVLKTLMRHFENQGRNIY